MFAFQKKKLLQIQLEKKAHLKWVNKLLRKLKKIYLLLLFFGVNLISNVPFK